MNELHKDTEVKILEAAEVEFIQNGLAGTRMQEIANRAGINKALLHYYYRSKDKLFYQVFKLAMSKFTPNITKLLKEEYDLFDFIRDLVNEYGKIIMKNQFIPLFVLSELRRNPDLLVDAMLSSGIKPQLFIEKVEKAKAQGKIIDIDPRNIIINTLSMIIFPVAGQPLMQRLFFNDDKKAYQKFLEERIKIIPDFIINSIKTK